MVPRIILPNALMDDILVLNPIFDLVKSGITIADEHSKILYVNPAFTEITGYSYEEAMGENPGMLRSGYHSAAFYREMWGVIRRDGLWQGEIWNRRKSGEIYPSWLTISKLTDKQVSKVLYLAVFSDITFLEVDQTKVVNLAFHDPLTHLPNRLALGDAFRSIMRKYEYDTEAGKRADYKVGAIFLDLNEFKQVNDQHGHVVGDKLLKCVAHRLQSTITHSEIIARIGGDEFIAILPKIGNKNDVDQFCDTLKKIFTQPFDVDGIRLTSTASMGVSIFPDDAKNFEELIKTADERMYADKKSPATGGTKN